MDEFDTYYLHLFIWNRAAREVVGAYRLGQSDRILQNFGIKGFYTATLFSYHRAFIEQVNPALEMGRSFVRIEYQRSYAPLLLLWRGIGAYARQNPHYKILFGPVSISNDYHPNSRELMVNFLNQYCRAEDLVAPGPCPQPVPHAPDPALGERARRRHGLGYRGTLDVYRRHRDRSKGRTGTAQAVPEAGR